MDVLFITDRHTRADELKEVFNQTRFVFTSLQPGPNIAVMAEATKVVIVDFYFDEQGETGLRNPANAIMDFAKANTEIAPNLKIIALVSPGCSLEMAMKLGAHEVVAYKHGEIEELLSEELLKVVSGFIPENPSGTAESRTQNRKEPQFGRI